MPDPRPNLTPWHVVGDTLERTSRHPLRDAVVRSVGDGVTWMVTRPTADRVDLVAMGTVDDIATAKAAATAALLKAR